jgi:NAD(P)-dependent dehydrogenase (short-subunit alcohol dehydrogenase family)
MRQLREFGRIDVMINNAGVMPSRRRSRRFKVDDWVSRDDRREHQRCDVMGDRGGPPADEASRNPGILY